MRRWTVFALAVFTAVLVSSELGLSLPIFGVAPDLLIVVVVSWAIGAQPRTAAIMGFTVGLVRDLLLTSPKGLSAFAYALTAWLVAAVGPFRGVWAFVGVVAVATMVSQTLYGLSASLFSENIDLGALPRVVLVSSAYNALLAPLVMPLLRRLSEGQRPETDGSSS